MVAIVGVIGVLLLGAVACLGLGGIGTLAAFLGMGGDDEVKVDTTPKPKPKPSKRTRDTGKDKKTKKGKKVKPKPGGRPRPKPRPGGGSSNPKPKPKPARPKPKPAPTPTGGPAKISFRSNGRGDVSCGGAKKKFDGIVTIRVDEFQLPATCLVTIGSGRGVFQVFGSGTVTCNEANGNVTCNPPQVP